MTSRRIKQNLCIKYKDFNKLKKLIVELERMLYKHPEINKKMVYFVRVIEFKKSFLEVMLYAFTITTEFAKFYSVREDILLKVLEICERNNIQIAQNSFDISISNKNEKDDNSFLKEKSDKNINMLENYEKLNNKKS